MRFPYDIHHILCIFHLFDTNIKRAITPVLKSKHGTDSWLSFRASLEMCREAGSISEFNDLWEQLLNNWFSARNFAKERNYLRNHVWKKRKQWCTAFFQREFTLGHCTTQRSESFNAVLKCFKNSFSLVSLVTKIKHVVPRQCLKKNLWKKEHGENI